MNRHSIRLLSLLTICFLPQLKASEAQAQTRCRQAPAVPPKPNIPTNLHLVISPNASMIQQGSVPPSYETLEHLKEPAVDQHSTQTVFYGQLSSIPSAPSSIALMTPSSQVVRSASSSVSQLSLSSDAQPSQRNTPHLSPLAATQPISSLILDNNMQQKCIQEHPQTVYKDSAFYQNIIQQIQAKRTNKIKDWYKAHSKIWRTERLIKRIKERKISTNSGLQQITVSNINPKDNREIERAIMACIWTQQPLLLAQLIAACMDSHIKFNELAASLAYAYSKTIEKQSLNAVAQALETQKQQLDQQTILQNSSKGLLTPQITAQICETDESGPISYERIVQKIREGAHK